MCPVGWVFRIRKPAMKTVLVRFSHSELVDASAETEWKALPTEELAELHAIIQAIEYERRGATNS
jgi:hypothetical protein